MTDIVERLREIADANCKYCAFIWKAADEIERLHAALATCRELREIDKALIAKLRAPLNIHHRGSET